MQKGKVTERPWAKDSRIAIYKDAMVLWQPLNQTPGDNGGRVCPHQARHLPHFPHSRQPPHFCCLSFHSPTHICPPRNPPLLWSVSQRPLAVHPPTSRTVYDKDESCLHLTIGPSQQDRGTPACCSKHSWTPRITPAAIRGL